MEGEKVGYLELIATQTERIKEMQAELDRRTEIEEAALRYMAEGEYQKAIDILEDID